MTEGSILKKLILFSLPMMAGNLLQQIYNLVDTIIVGKYIGSHALAAVGSSYTFMIFITSIIIGLCMGSGAFFSADYGAKDMEKFQKDMGHSFLLIGGITVILYGILYPFMNGILWILHIPTELFAMTKDYMDVILVGLVFVFLYNFFAYILRSMGDSVSSLVFLGISSFMNIILDITFVLYFHMGVKGAAIATVTAQGFAGMGIAIYSFVKYPFIKRNLIPEKIDRKDLKRILKNDVATGIQQSVMNFGILMIQGLVNSFGAVIMAAFAAAVKIDTIAYMPAQEFGNAYSLFVSQNYGAKKHDRIRKGTFYAMMLSAVFCILVSCCIFMFAKPLMKIFVDGSEADIIREGVTYLRIEGAMYVGISILFLWYGYFRGIAKPYVSLILTIISLGTRVVLSYSLAPYTALGVTAIWISIPVGWILADIAGLYFYKKKDMCKNT